MPPPAWTWFQILSHSKTAQTLLNHVPNPHILPQTCLLQYNLGQNPSKVVLPAWEYASSPDSVQHHSKMTPTLGRGKDNHTYQSKCCPSSGPGADIWCDCRSYSPIKASQETTQGKCPAVLCYCSSGKSQSEMKPKSAPDWSTKNEMIKPFAHRQAKKIIEGDRTEGKGGFTTIGHMQHT